MIILFIILGAFGLLSLIFFLKPSEDLPSVEETLDSDEEDE